MVFLANGDAIAASQIRIGDQLSNGPVTDIKQVQLDGLYSPLTRSGTIYVDNNLASCYATMSGVTHALAHLVTAPARWLGLSFSASSNTPVMPVPVSI